MDDIINQTYDSLVKRLLHGMGATVVLNSLGVISVTFSPDGSTIISGLMTEPFEFGIRGHDD